MNDYAINSMIVEAKHIVFLSARFGEAKWVLLIKALAASGFKVGNRTVAQEDDEKLGFRKGDFLTYVFLAPGLDEEKRLMQAQNEFYEAHLQEED